MQTAQEFLTGVKNFALFFKVEKLLFGGPIKIQCSLWTPEILRFNCNQIIDQFLETAHNNIDEFFEEFLMDMFGNELIKKQKYCFKLYLTLDQMKNQSQMFAVYHDLFANRVVYPIFNLFWEMKALIFELKGFPSTYHVVCDEIFLRERQWQYVLNRLFLFSLCQITDFEDEMSKTVFELKRDKKTRTNIHKYMRNNEYCASFLIYMAMQRFYQILEETGHKSGSILKLDQETGYKEILKKVSEMQQPKEEIINPYIVKTEIYKSKVMESKRLMREIKSISKNISQFKISTVKTIGVLEEIDKIGAFCKNLITERRQEIMSMKETKLSSEDDSTMNSTLTDFLMPEIKALDKIDVYNATDAKQKIMGLHLPTYTYLKHKLIEDKPSIIGLVKKLKKVIFDESFNLSRDDKEKTMFDFTEEVYKIFGEMPKLEKSHVLILDSILNNIPSSNSLGYDEIKISNTFNYVSENLLSQIEKLLGTSDVIFEEKVSVQHAEAFETFNLEIGKPTSMKFESFMKKNDVGCNSKELSNRELKDQMIEINFDQEKHKFLREEFFDILRFSKKLGLFPQPRLYINSKKRMSLTKKDGTFEERTKDLPSNKTNFSFGATAALHKKSKCDVEDLKASDYEGYRKAKLKTLNSVNVFEDSERQVIEHQDDFHPSLKNNLGESKQNASKIQTTSSNKHLKDPIGNAYNAQRIMEGSIANPSNNKHQFINETGQSSKHNSHNRFDNGIGRTLTNTQGSKQSRLVPANTHADESMEEKDFSPEVNSLQDEDIGASLIIKPENNTSQSLTVTNALRRISDTHLSDLTSKLMRES